jgi:hypothetical protein
MKKLIFTLALFITTLCLNAQYTPPSIQWQKCLGGTNDDFAYSIRQCFDGCFIVAGYSKSNDGDILNHHGTTSYNDAWVIKLDTSGNILWQRSLGGSLADAAFSIQQTADTGFIVGGLTTSSDGDVTFNYGGTDYWIVKLDTSGNIQWQKCLGGTATDKAYSIKQTKDRGYIVAGTTNSNNGDVSGNHSTVTGYDYWVVKLDTSGNIQWQKCLGGSQWDEAYSIQETNDSGYIVTGYTQSNDGDVTGNNGYYSQYDYWVVKLNNLGNIQWQKCLGGTQSDWALSIKQTFDGNYIVAGLSDSNDSDVTGHHGNSYFDDFWIVKLDTSGNILWQRSYGGTQSENAYDIQQTNDSGFVICGIASSNNGDVTGLHGIYCDVWVVKIDSAGNLQWQKTLGGSKIDYGESIQQIKDNGYILAGYTLSNDGDVSGNHDTSGIHYDYWIVKLGPAPLEIQKQKISSNILIYPNPSDRNFTVNVPNNTKYIEISNSLGQVLEKRNVYHEEKVNFEIKDDGFYFVRIVTDKESITKKVIMSK